jgi:isoleucyl-tRNA synthetase
MDKSYMESVWWVFKQLFDKKAVYRGYKVMPYSTALTTPLSNNEAQVRFLHPVRASGCAHTIVA